MATSDHQLELRFETLAVHAGVEPDPLTGAVMTPIYQTSTYALKDVDQQGGYVYSRSENPTRTSLQEALATLEGGRFGLAFASGMAATDTLLRLVKPGQHVICGDNIYGGTFRLFDKVLSGHGLKFTFVNTSDTGAFAAAVRPNTKLIWLETPTNPKLQLGDVRRIAAIAREAGAWLAVDNTFASPALQRPLALGADFVMHSTTKYLAGHSDVVGGALVLNDQALYDELKFLQNAVGAVPGPLDCFLTLRGLKTLALRMQAHSRNGLDVARFLADHPAIARVNYPGLPDHPQHDLARAQMKGFGGMVSFIPRGGPQAARAIAANTRLFTLAVSLGGVESLIEVPAAMTHASMADSPQALDPALLRLSVGIENVDDLVADLAQSLAAL